MNNNEIKKALYKERPMAKCAYRLSLSKKYLCRLSDGTRVKFKVPFSEMGESEFDNEMPAKLLIRWLVNDEY